MSQHYEHYVKILGITVILFFFLSLTALLNYSPLSYFINNVLNLILPDSLLNDPDPGNLIDSTTHWISWAIFVFNVIHALKSKLITVRTSPSSRTPQPPWRRMAIDCAAARPRDGAGRHRRGQGRQGEEGLQH